MDGSPWMAGLGSFVLDRAVPILSVPGVFAVVVLICAQRLQAQLRLLRWAIRRPFHNCAACHARNSSVALWRWPDRSPCWLCVECAFGVKDFGEVPRGRRQPGAQVASRGEHVGRAGAFWSAVGARPQVHAPVRRAKRASTSDRLTSGNRGQRTRVAVPPAVANRHRRGRHEAGLFNVHQQGVQGSRVPEWKEAFDSSNSTAALAQNVPA